MNESKEELPWLAIDPSFRNTGWVIMDSLRVYCSGLIETKEGLGYVHLDNQRCLRWMCDGLDVAIRESMLHYGVESIHSEAKGGSKSAKAGTMMAMAQAVVSCKAHQWGLSLKLVLAGRAKEVATGNRRASKDDVRAAMLGRYPELPGLMELGGYTQKARQEHIFDAAACGYAISKEKTS